RRLACDGHLGRVSAEGVNVALDPLQGGDDIEQAVIPRAWTEGRGRQKSESADSIVQRDDDDSLLRQVSTFVDCHRAGPAREGSAVHPHQDGPTAGRISGPYVQKQTVFRSRAGDHVFRCPRTEALVVAYLRATRGKFGSGPDSLPLRRARGWTPARRTHWG